MDYGLWLTAGDTPFEESCFLKWQFSIGEQPVFGRPCLYKG